MNGPNIEVTSIPQTVTGGSFGSVIDATQTPAQVTGDLNVQGALTVNGSPISGGTPGGLNAQVQYNNNGAFAGATITTDGSGLSVPGDLHVDGNIYVSAGTDGQVLYKSGGVISDDANLLYTPTTGLQIGALNTASVPMSFSQTSPNDIFNNGAIGHYTMNTAGETTVFFNTMVKTTSLIFLTWYNTDTGTPDRLGVLNVVAQADGSFSVASSSPTDKGVYAYMIINQVLA